ncbi:hypothetical protein [Sphingobium sp. CAP-1]|uniref:hypothetical protein n=1 Tax=Sphingobium sp. CAP-1 TaxID=2676077 RepID=UPI0012BB29B5|nr:hypothetical protein [Sphingobium sp. CAP-1]QGP80030.1 hypothetical protein GL174_14315 [Sphingobium sp. CAP-1]
MTEIEQDVSEAMAADPYYPLGETDAMKWAVAWRLIRDRNCIDANASQAAGDIDGWMVGWFANAMASAAPKMVMTRGDEQGEEGAVIKDGLIPETDGRADRNDLIARALRKFTEETIAKGADACRAYLERIEAECGEGANVRL